MWICVDLWFFADFCWFCFFDRTYDFQLSIFDCILFFWLGQNLVFDWMIKMKDIGVESGFGGGAFYLM